MGTMTQKACLPAKHVHVQIANQVGAIDHAGHGLVRL